MGFPGSVNMEQREAKGSAIHFYNCKYFSLAERVESKAEERREKLVCRGS